MVRTSHRHGLAMGLVLGVAASVSAGYLMGQGTTTQPGSPSGRQTAEARAGSEYFVTGDATRAQLWMRDGTTLRWVSSSDATNRVPTDRPNNPDVKNPSSLPDPVRPK